MSATQMPKLHVDLTAQPNWSGGHRSGWPYVLKEGLLPLHHPQGVWLDSFMERTFAWEVRQERALGRIPYRWPWVGFFHNPPGIPIWHDYHNTPQALLATAALQESLPQCLGLFVLSDYLRAWLQPRVAVPVSVLRHPTETPDLRFTMDRFRNNPRPRLIHIGVAVRRFHSFFELAVTRLHKCLLTPRNPRFPSLLQREKEVLGYAHRDEDRVEVLPFASPERYDALLAENLVFCHLFDSSANNVIVECIARDTPVLVNRLPAVAEYLGADYPLFFDTAQDAARLAENMEAIAAAHEHLKRLPKDWLSVDFFRASVEASTVYRNLPNPNGETVARA